MTTRLTGSVHSTNKPCSQSNEQLVVNVYSKTLSSKKLLQKVAVNEKGVFTAHLEYDKKPKYSLWLELVSKHNEKEAISIAENGPHCLEEEIHVSFQYNPKDYVVEFDYLEQVLKLQLGSKKPQNLVAEDIRELACISCVEELDIRKWVNAYQYAVAAEKLSKTCIKKENTKDSFDKECINALQQLLKLGSTATALYQFVDTSIAKEVDLASVLTQSESQFQEELARAVRDKKISLAKERISDFAKAFTCLRNCLLFNNDYDGRYYDAKLIHLTNYDSNLKNHILNQSLEHGGLALYLSEEKNVTKDKKEPAKSLQKSEVKTKKISGIDLTDIKHLIQWDEYTRKFPPLLALIIPKLREKEWDKTNFLKYDKDEWEKGIKSVSGSVKTPSSYKDKKEPIQSYAYDLTRTLTDQFPTEKLVSQLKQSKLPNKNDFYRVLSRNPNFDIQNQAVSRHFTKGESDRTPEVISERDYKNLQELQRTIKLADGVENIHLVEALLKEDLSSGMQIIRLGKFDFNNTMLKYEFQDWEIRGIWCRAKAYYDTSKEIMRQYLQYDGKDAFMPDVLKRTDVTTANSPTALNLPDMELLFGSLNRCSCKHCQSVYSPAAYLTDMLQWLKSDVSCQQTNKNGFTEIDSRRPDIKYIQLNCKNTNTVLPYIDLVNEVLLSHLEGNNPSEALLRDLQTTWETDRLLMEPEHINHIGFDQAKAKLKSTLCPISLPYDINWTESRKYLSELGTSQAELIKTFSSNRYPHYHTIEWANAYLGINDETYKFLIQPSPTTTFWKKHFNISSATNNLGYFLQFFKIEKEDFQQIYETKFVSNKTTLLPLEADFQACDWNEFEISSTWDSPTVQRFLRFLRLRNLSGLRTQQLDKAIFTYNNTDINKASLINLASMLDISVTYSLEFDEVLVWFSNDPFSPSSLFDWSSYYKDIYLKPTYSTSRTAFFEPSFLNSTANSAKVKSLSNEQKEWINQSLGLQDGDIGLLNTHWFGSGNPKLKTIELQFYHIHASLAKVLNLTIAELVACFKLYGSPFDGYPNDAAEVFYFTNHVKESTAIKLPLELVANSYNATGFFEIQNNRANNSEFEDISKGTWEKLVLKISDLYIEHSSAYDTIANKFATKPAFVDSVPNLKDEFYQMLAHELEIEHELFERILDKEDNQWYVSCLDNIISGTDWASGSDILFTPTFRSLYRIKLYSIGFELDYDGLDVLFDVYANNTYILPVNDALFWLGNDFTVHNFHHMLWLRKLTAIKNTFDVAYKNILTQIEALHQLSGVVSAANLDSILNACYADLQLQDHLEVSSQQFKDIYLRAQCLAINPKDLIETLTATFKLIGREKALHIPVPTLWFWIWDGFDVSGNVAVDIGEKKGDILSVLQSKYTDEQWSKIITLIHNQFRTQLRDALIAYYIHNKSFNNKNDIYAHFLLDPEMEACMKTSRTKLAISGMQMLIHRAMMGLELNLCPTEDNKHEWEWRKNYRVWEANRKVFLYPENWIEPELRLDKSEFFEELEDALLQDEINDANAEKAMQRYLSNLNKVARLDIRGTYFESDGSGEYGAGTFHVVGRTFSTPHEYYYRKREVNRVWTAWEKLELDIEGDHIIPVVHNRKLHLYWPMFIEKEDRNIKRTIKGQEQNAPYFEIRLCYSKLEFGKWSAKKILDGQILAGHLAGKGCFNNLRYKLGQDVGYKHLRDELNPNWWPFKPNPDYPYGERGPLIKVYGPDETNNGSLVWSNSVYQDYAPVSMDKNKFYFWAEKNTTTGELTIHIRRDFDEGVDNYHDGYTELAYEDSFRISACDDRIEIIPPVIEEVLFGEPTNENRFLARPYNTLPNAQLMIEGKDVEKDKYPNGGLYAKREITHGHGSDRILNNTNGTYRLTHLHQYKHVYSHLPFFMADNLHTLFFEKRVEKRCVKIPLFTNGSENIYYTSEYRNVLSKYHVQPHEHPYACLMLSEMNQFGVKGLLASKNRNNQLRRQQQSATYFENQYQPVSQFIEKPYPIDEFDFSYFGAYQQYNWEIFFHAPSLIARQLKSNGQFADAIKWLQFIFDPTNRDIDYGDKRFWMIKPFLQDVSEDSIQNLMHLLGATGLNPNQEQKRTELKAQIEAWRNNPFEPHKIAEMRYRTYMLWTVCEYIDVLIEWGDSLFRQDSIESLNEASNLYILAAELLGNRPQTIEKPTNDITNSFADLGKLDAFSNSIVNIESEIPSYNPTICCKEDNNDLYQLPDLLFCIPDNPKLQELWNRVEDRLFKIRHCMNIEGQIRELPLFQPPIDPALLVRARVMGLDIGEVLQDLSKPEPHYRYNYLLQKANEFTGEVKGLGGALLSALEKKDAEELSLLRQLHEQNILKATKNLKKMAIEEAKLGLASAQHSKELIEIRLAEYEGKEYMNTREKQSLFLTGAADILMGKEKEQMLLSQIFGLIPQFHAGPFPDVETGGRTLSEIASMVGTSYGIQASVLRNGASMASTYGSYDRRQEDWDFQVKTAKEELKQVEKSILSAEIRLAIAERDLENHELQIEQSKEVFDFVKTKFTNLNLYSWMSGELMKLHYRAYKLAYEMAKQAERAMHKELNVDLSIIDFVHWNSSKKGLLAGEQLSMQLKELDNAYIKNDKRRFELSKDISLKLLDPKALVNLIQNKYCKVKLEESLLNLVFKSRDLKGMQIKSIGISIPCVTGPQVSTNVKLRIQSGEELITSSGINDMGVFEPNFNQARYMPFEYMKLESERTFELLLDENSEYDITTISDVVLHINYYAENNGTDNIEDEERKTVSNNSHLMMSWKHDFPLEWQYTIDDLTNSAPDIKTEHIPYKMRNSGFTVDQQAVKFFVVLEKGKIEEITTTIPSKKLSDNSDFTIVGNNLKYQGEQVLDVWMLFEK